jgi:methanogenic corrinoid protein MtbC1
MMIQSNSRYFASNYLENLLHGDRKQCSSIVKEYLLKNPSITDVYEQVLKVALYELGKLWETNKISVATEHMATAISEGILNELFVRINPSEKYNKKVIVACVENEKHQVGIKMVADVFEMQGWESFFLGGGIPLNELVKYIHEIEPDILAVSLSVYFNYASLVSMIQKIQQEFPALLIILGGQAFRRMNKDIPGHFSNVTYIPDLYFLEKYIRLINSKT